MHAGDRQLPLIFFFFLADKLKCIFSKNFISCIILYLGRILFPSLEKRTLLPEI